MMWTSTGKPLPDRCMARSTWTYPGMRHSPHWNNCQTIVRKFFLVPCCYLPLCNFKPTLWSPTVQFRSRSTYSVPTYSQQTQQIAGAQLPFSSAALTPLPHPWVCDGEYLDWDTLPNSTMQCVSSENTYTHFLWTYNILIDALLTGHLETINLIKTFCKQCYTKYLKISLMYPLHSTSPD